MTARHGASTPAPTWRSLLLRISQFGWYYRSEIAFLFSLGAISVAIHWLRNIKYPVFHTVVSIFYIAVACFFYLLSLGTLAWSENMLVHLLGVVFLYSAILTGIHMLAFPGMGLLPNIDENNVAAQLYIAMRYFQSVGFAAAFAFVVWRTRRVLSSTLEEDGIVVTSAAAATAGGKRVGDREDSRALPPMHGLRPQARSHQGLSPAIQLTPVDGGTPPMPQPQVVIHAPPVAAGGRVKLQIVAPIVPMDGLSPAPQPLLTPLTPDTNSSSDHTPHIPTLSELHARPSFKRQSSDSPQMILKDGEAYWNYPRSLANDNRDDASESSRTSTDRIIQLKPEDEVRGIKGSDLWTYRFSHVIGTVYTVLHALFVFMWPIYPDCFIQPTGLTWFKKGSEFAIIVLHIISLVILLLFQQDLFPKTLNFNEKEMLDAEEPRKRNSNAWMRSSASNPRIPQSVEERDRASDEDNDQSKPSKWHTNTHIQPIPWMIGGLVLNIAAEICYTTYGSLTADANMLGHLFEFCATSMLSRGMFEAVFKSPLVILFKSANLQHIKLKETLSELKIAHQQLKSRVKLAGTAQFQALMQHEIRTPMNGLLGLSELLLEEVKVVDPGVYQQHQQQRQTANNLEPALHAMILATHSSHSRAKDIKVSLSHNNSPSSISRSIRGSSSSASFAQVPESYLTPDHRSMLTTIHHCAGQLLSVLNGVLDIASIDAHTLHLESIPVDLAKLAARVVSVNEASANAKQIKLTLSMTGERGAKLMGNEAILLADPHRLNQIFSQFVTNGIKFGKEGGSVNLSVQLLETMSTAKLVRSKSRLHQEAAAAAVSINNTRHHMRHIRIEVTDCCGGIHEDRLATIFEPFASSVGGDMQNLLVRPNLQGLGLGLTLCKHLIQQMHGAIGCTNNVHNRGCVFFADVFLPVPTSKDFETMAHVHTYNSPMAIELPSPMRLQHFTGLEADSHPPIFHSSRMTEESRVGAFIESNPNQRDTSKAWSAPVGTAKSADGSLDSQPMALSQLEHVDESKQNTSSPVEFPAITIHSEPTSDSDSGVSPDLVARSTKPQRSQSAARITVDTAVNVRLDDSSPRGAGTGEPNSAGAAPSPSMSQVPSPSGSPGLPIRKDIQDPKTASSHQPSPLSAARRSVSPSTSVHILVVDDSSVNRRVLCHMLKHVCAELGWQVSVQIAENGQEGLDRYKQSLIDEKELFTRTNETLPNHVPCASAAASANSKAEAATSSKKQPSVKLGLYDLVFMDLMMPVMDGITCTRMIRQSECEQLNEWKLQQETQKQNPDNPTNGTGQCLRAPVRLPIVALTAMVTVEGVEESVSSMLYSGEPPVKSGSSTPFSSLPSLPVTLFDEKILKPINKQQLKNLLIAIKPTTIGQTLEASLSKSPATNHKFLNT